jgi:hypothetical protein
LRQEVGVSGVRERTRRGVVEFLAIFLGVSLSFLADDWRETRGERREEARVIELLASDLQQDLSGIRRQIAQDSAAADAGQWLHLNWNRSDLPLDSLEWAWGAVHDGGPYSPVRSEYESAKSAGRLQLIRDASIRQQVAAYYEQEQPHLQTVNRITIDFDFDVWRLLRPDYQFSVAYGRGVIPAIDVEYMWPRAATRNEVRSALVQATGFRRLITRQMRAHLDRTIDLEARLREYAEG